MEKKKMNKIAVSVLLLVGCSLAENVGHSPECGKNYFYNRYTKKCVYAPEQYCNMIENGIYLKVSGACIVDCSKFTEKKHIPEFNIEIDVFSLKGYQCALSQVGKCQKDREISTYYKCLPQNEKHQILDLTKITNQRKK